MPLDSLTLRALTDELGQVLIDARVDKIHMPVRDEVHMLIRGSSGSSRLLLSAGAHPRVHITRYVKENPASPPMFCMLLRKHLSGSRIVSVSQPELERVVIIEFDTADEMGQRCRKTLVAELMGRHSNLILCDENQRIIDCLRRVDMEMSERRQVLPGLFYRLPPAQDKLSLLSIGVADFSALLSVAPPEFCFSEWLLKTFSGFSPLVARSFAVACGGVVSVLIEQIDSSRAGETWSSLRRRIERGDFVPVLLSSSAGPADYSCLPPEMFFYGYVAEQKSGFSALVDDFYAERDRTNLMRQRASDMTRLLTSTRDRTRRRLNIQRQEHQKTLERDRFRLFGDLLMTYPHLVLPGASSVTLEDYNSGCPVDIPLDATMTAHQNAARYYREYRKAQTAEQRLSEQIRLGEDELNYLESVLDAIVRARSAADLQEIRDELAAEGLLSKAAGKRKRATSPSAPLRFVSSAGLDILVGRNNRQNDLLTMKTARHTDLWFHTQKIPGSHVVVRLADSFCDDATLHEAAVLAATFSAARDAGKVPVDYTQVARVKKPPGAKPGMVIYTDQKTMYVTPDETLAVRLVPRHES